MIFDGILTPGISSTELFHVECGSHVYDYKVQANTDVCSGTRNEV